MSERLMPALLLAPALWLFAVQLRRLLGRFAARGGRPLTVGRIVLVLGIAAAVAWPFVFGRGG